MRFLVLGASGLVGSTLARLATIAGHDVIGSIGTWSGGQIVHSGQQARVDLMDSAETESLVRKSDAAVIVNAAAVSDPGKCEVDPIRSQQLNVDVPAQLATLAEQSGTRLIHLSSDQVFDGSAAPYSVGDQVRGISLYARQKIASEQQVHAKSRHAVTLRLPLLLGNSLSGRRSVHERLLELWTAGQEARLYTDEIRQPCTADSVARAILEIAKKPELTGLFHWAGAEPLSRFEIGRKIRLRFGLDEKRAPIVAVERKDDPRALLTRQANLALNLRPLVDRLMTQPQTSAEAFSELEPPVWWEPN